MSPYLILLLAFLLGAVTGLRCMTAPAVTAWAAHLGWIELQGTPLAFMGSTAAVAICSILAAGELVYDKLPKAPPRTAPSGLIARLGLGALVGAAIALAGKQPAYLGAILGAAGGLTGAFAGYRARVGSVRALRTPDFVIALLEDAIAIGGALFIVSQF